MVLDMKDRAARVFNVSLRIVSSVVKTRLNWTEFQIKGKQFFMTFGELIGPRDLKCGLNFRYAVKCIGVPRNFVRGWRGPNSVEDREKGDLEAVAP